MTDPLCPHDLHFLACEICSKQGPAVILTDNEVLDLLKALKAIENYCTTPHWTADRRWLIEQSARNARAIVEKKIVK